MPIFVKPNRPIHAVFIHCSASDSESANSIKVIRGWHVDDKGWPDVGYHYFIRKNGLIETGRDLELIPAAQVGFNEGSIAICLHGLMKSHFTEAQFDALREIAAEIEEAYGPGNIRYRGHNEVSDKDCPVFDIGAELSLGTEGYQELPPPEILNQIAGPGQLSPTMGAHYDLEERVEDLEVIIKGLFSSPRSDMARDLAVKARAIKTDLEAKIAQYEHSTAMSRFKR